MLVGTILGLLVVGELPPTEGGGFSLGRVSGFAKAYTAPENVFCCVRVRVRGMPALAALELFLVAVVSVHVPAFVACA